MHKFIAFFSLSGAVLCGYQITCPQPTPSVYEIEFSGNPGKRLFAQYQLFDPSGRKPTRIEKIEAVLPYKITITPSAGYQVNATAIQDNETGSIEISISRDGVDCTKPEIVGSTFAVLTSCLAR